MAGTGRAGLDPPLPHYEGGTVKTVPYVPAAVLEIAGQARNDDPPALRCEGGTVKTVPYSP